MTSTSILRLTRQVKVSGPYSFSLVFEPAEAYSKAIAKSMEKSETSTEVFEPVADQEMPGMMGTNRMALAIVPGAGGGADGTEFAGEP